jgi:hypothetical protein
VHVAAQMAVFRERATSDPDHPDPRLCQSWSARGFMASHNAWSKGSGFTSKRCSWVDVLSFGFHDPRVSFGPFRATAFILRIENHAELDGSICSSHLYLTGLRYAYDLVRKKYSRHECGHGYARRRPEWPIYLEPTREVQLYHYQSYLANLLHFWCMTNVTDQVKADCGQDPRPNDQAYLGSCFLMTGVYTSRYF